jgi:hypothetical protein
MTNVTQPSTHNKKRGAISDSENKGHTMVTHPNAQGLTSSLLMRKITQLAILIVPVKNAKMRRQCKQQQKWRTHVSSIKCYCDHHINMRKKIFW